eukprot:6012166-Prymnesium_polylepis.1
MVKLVRTEAEAPGSGVRVINAFSFDYGVESSARTAVRRLATMSTPVNVIFALVFDGDVPDVCDEASSHGLLTSEYVWIDGQGLSTQPLPSTVNRSQTGLCLNGWLQIASTLPTAGYSRYEAAWAQAVVADCANEVFTPPSNIFTAAAPDLGVYEYDAAAAMILALDSVTTAQETDGDAVRAAVAVLDFEGASGRMKFEASLD